MAKTRRRVLSILMALVLTLGLLPTTALAHSGNTTIKVVDAQTGAPIQNAKVTVEHWFYGSGSTYTDPNGIAPFNLTLAYADYSVSVSAAGYQPGSGSVNAYQTKVIRLTPDGSGARKARMPGSLSATTAPSPMRTALPDTWLPSILPSIPAAGRARVC